MIFIYFIKLFQFQRGYILVHYQVCLLHESDAIFLCESKYLNHYISIHKKNGEKRNMKRGLMSYLRYLCLFANSGVQHILCCVFVMFFCKLPISLGCPFLIAPSVFSSVYLYNAVIFFIYKYLYSHTAKYIGWLIDWFLTPTLAIFQLYTLVQRKIATQ